MSSQVVRMTMPSTYGLTNTPGAMGSPSLVMANTPARPLVFCLVNIRILIYAFGYRDSGPGTPPCAQKSLSRLGIREFPCFHHRFPEGKRPCGFGACRLGRHSG